MLAVLAASLAVVVLVALIPVDCVMKFTWQSGFQRDVRIRWCFGLVRLQIPNRGRSLDAEPAIEPGTEAISAGVTRDRQRNWLAAVRYQPFRQRLVRFAGDLWRLIQKQDVRMRMRLGLGDPADTGQLWALLGPVSGVLHARRDADIRVEPDFNEAVFEADASGRIRIVPASLLGVTVLLLCSPPFWRGLKLARSAA